MTPWRETARRERRSVIMDFDMSRSVKATNPATQEQTASVSSGDGARWSAVLRRDASADGRFFYSVRTTGVYCRPSCSARRARRENVRFHDSWQDAERAGFRACLRCRPKEAALAERHAVSVAKACRLIEAADETPDLGALAAAAGMSRFHFHRVFKQVTGVTPKTYAAARREERMREELARDGSVTDAIYASGFNSSGRFYAASGRALGMTPTRFRSGGAGVAIRFAVGQCSLGAILVAATEKGVCGVFLGDDPDALVRELQDRFPNATLLGGERGFERWVARVVGFIESPAQKLDLPLDLRGTAFQRRVWQALQKIPRGSTVSYTELAKRVGAPKSVRAVARACATNPIAVAIPCHRVVRRDGSLSGYRWGVERKRALLDREARSRASR
jgi:AraC family transcriptional regulator of adaptative response/methylated-DNA-[protein]-cysteine methyltransferase